MRVAEMIFKLSQIHAAVIYHIPDFFELIDFLIHCGKTPLASNSAERY